MVEVIAFPTVTPFGRSKATGNCEWLRHSVAIPRPFTAQLNQVLCVMSMPDFSTIAEIAVALVGFSGIVLAIGSGGHGSEDIDRARLADLLIAGFGVVFLALLPTFFVLFLQQELTWRVVSGIFAAWFLLGIASFWIRMKADFVRAPANAFGSVIGAGFIIGLLGVCFGIWIEIAHAIYFAALLWGLFVAAMEFTLLLLGLQKRDT